MLHPDISYRDRHERASVLAAVGGPDNGLDAVAWAAAEAAARHACLHLLRVVPWNPFEHDYIGPGDAGAYDAAQQTVDNAAEHARRVAPHLPIATLITTGETAHTIALEGANADLIVLGRKATCRPDRRSNRSLTLQVTARSQRPVAVIGFAAPPLNGSGAGRVVAAAPSYLAPTAAWAILGTAFDAAQRRGIGVTVLVDAPGPGQPGGSTVVDALAAQYQQLFADVDLRRQPLTGPHGSLLTHASRSAALVVLPVPETRVARWRSRSAIRRLIETVPGPITFVHPRSEPRLVRPTTHLGGRR